jgi:hypothetical protein
MWNPLPPPPFPLPQSFDMRFNMAVDYTPAPSASPSPAAMVDSVVIPRRSVWQFTENVSDAVAGWNTQAFNDGMWSYGPGPLGFGDNPVSTPAHESGRGGERERESTGRRSGGACSWLFDR